jgi:hypothetical protein
MIFGEFTMKRLFSYVAMALLLSGNAAAQEKIAEAVAVEAPGAAKIAKARPLTITVELTSDTKIAGTLVETNQLMMKTSFGEASIPLSEVAGIRFASANDNSTTVVMLNGDSITGATDLKMMTVETEWGTAKINGSSIQSVLFVPDLRWNASAGLSGKRWMLVDSKQPGGQVVPAGGQVVPSTGTNLPGTVVPTGGQPVVRRPGTLTNPVPPTILPSGN